MASGDTQHRNLKSLRKNPCALLRKLVGLIENPISENTSERHLQLLHEFLNASHYAFWLFDIPYVHRLYECIIKRIDTIPDYKKPMECLLNFSATPPMLTKISEQVEYSRDFQEYFSILGYLILYLQDNHLKKITLNTISSLIKPKPPIGYCCVPLDYCNESIEKSHLPEILVKLLPVIGDLYPLLIDVVFLTSQISTPTCHKMLQQNALEYLLQGLDPDCYKQNGETKPKNPSPKDTIPAFEDTCCILWNLLTAMEGNKVAVDAPSVSALRGLQYAFRWSIISPGQRMNRNNLATLILKILDTFPTIELVNSDLLTDIVSIASSAASCPTSSQIQFYQDELDFQFKKIIWACLHFVEQFDIGEVVKESDIVKAFVTSLFNEHSSDKSYIEQYCDLIKIILRTMPKIISYSVDSFVEIDGPAKILQIIEGYLVKTYDVDVLDAYMHCLSELVMMEISKITTNLGENDVTNIIMSVCSTILDSESLTRIHQKVLSRGFCILQILCRLGYISNCEIITLCLNSLNRVVRPNQDDTLIDARLTICVVRLLWECIDTRKRFLRKFLNRGGIYVMLDITESCTFPIRSLSLGVLADVSRKSASVPYLITWRKRGKKILPMLMDIFRDQTDALVCNGKQIDLFAEKTDNVWLDLCDVNFHGGCVTKTALLESCRFKIHAILYALKMKHRERVELANEHYKLFDRKLDTDDELTMLFAENFFSLNICESWKNIYKELNHEGIKLIDIDNVYLTEKIEQIIQWKLYLQHQIEKIVHKEKQNENLLELETYDTLKDPRLSDALDALKDLSYISICTERMFQMREKFLLLQQTDATHIANGNFHRTISDLPFTHLFNQTISIQSNIIYEKKEEQCPITPVSSGEEECVFESSDFDHSSVEYQLQC